MCVMSGNFVQRGEAAIAEKRLRAKAALLNGADLVLELPVPYAMSTAQNFALGGVSVLAAMGCEALMFGSECGEIEPLLRAADRLTAADFQTRLAKNLATGMSFAAARDQAADLGDLLQSPNNNLGVEYILAAKNSGANFRFFTVKRIGAAHHSRDLREGFASGAALREHLSAGDMDFCRQAMPENALALFPREALADSARLDRAILAVLRQKEEKDLKNLPDLSEGIENKLFSAIGVATCCEELYNMVKTKRVSHARVRRLVLSAFLGLDDAFFMKPPPYVRVLGMSRAGEQLLREKIGQAALPVILRSSEVAAAGAEAEKLFGMEARATDLFGLCLPVPMRCGLEFTAKMIKTEC